MELLLKPLDDINDPVWSVIILLCCGLAFTLYCVVYILRLSFKELEENGQVREQGQERSIEAESRERDCEES
jgi:flagellar biosynthesis/type III secretory pathway M-ring protein FliF/YscJ